MPVKDSVIKSDQSNFLLAIFVNWFLKFDQYIRIFQSNSVPSAAREGKLHIKQKSFQPSCCFAVIGFLYFNQYVRIFSQLKLPSVCKRRSMRSDRNIGIPNFDHYLFSQITFFSKRRLKAVNITVTISTFLCTGNYQYGQEFLI